MNDTSDTSGNSGVHPAQGFWQALTHFDATKVSYHRALRNAIGVALPLIVGFALDMPRGGLVVASGALNVSYSDGSDPYPTRARRMLASTFLCAIAVFSGAISGRHQVLAIVLATIWAFFAGMFYAVGGAAPDLGVISLVSLLIYAVQPLTPQEAAISGLLAMAGGLLQTGLSVALWPVHRYDPERRALANLYQQLANLAVAELNAYSAPPASAHSEQAQDALMGLARDAGPESLRYQALLNQAERMRLSLLMLSRLRNRMEKTNREYAAVAVLTGYLGTASGILRTITGLLSTTSAADEQHQSHELDEPIEQLEEATNRMRELVASTSPSFIAAVAKDALFQMAALGGQLRVALDLAGNQITPDGLSTSELLPRPDWRDRLSATSEMLRSNLTLQSAIFRHALRLATLVAVGDVLGRIVSWRRTYWLPMTIALVLKPEFTVTFTRGLLRVAGTIIGLLLTTALFHLFDPGVAMQIVLIFIFVFLLRWIGPANYGIFGIVVSGLIVLLLAINHVSPKDVIWARGINTAAGGALALIAYWLWPTWERTRISDRIAQMLDAYCGYLQEVTQARDHASPSTTALEKYRRSARTSRANLEASIDRLSSEPGTSRERMNRLTAVLASSHRFIHAVMALDAILSRDTSLADSAPLREFSTSVEKALTLLAAILRGDRVPPKNFPDLREQHRLMVQARNSSSKASAAHFDSINIEADRITNSVNTMAEQIMEWTRSPEFAAIHTASKPMALIS